MYKVCTCLLKLSYNFIAHVKQFSFLSGHCCPFDMSSGPGAWEGTSIPLSCKGQRWTLPGFGNELQEAQLEFLKVSRKPHFIGVLKCLSLWHASDANTDFGKGSLKSARSLSGPGRQSLLSHFVLGKHCGITFDQWAEALLVFLHFISRLGQLPWRESRINLEGQMRKNITAPSRQEEWCLLWSLCHKRLLCVILKSKTIMSVSSLHCASPPSLYIDSQACLQPVLSSCNVQYDVLQYQFNVNRIQIICPSWQKENSLGSIYTPKRKSVRLLPFPKELFWVPFFDDTHLKWSYRTMKYWPTQRRGPPYILITFINSQQSSSSMLDAFCPAKMSYCLPLLFLLER